MVQTTIKRSPQPLYSRDLVVCQRVFDDIRSRAGVTKETEEAERMAAITVELYRQGVREPSHLKQWSRPREACSITRRTNDLRHMQPKPSTWHQKGVNL